MTLKAMKCPSCGADITLDNDREFGFCSYCGSRIQIGEQINIHVTHEFKGETPHVNVTNQYFYGEDGNEDNDYKANIVIEKPKGKKMVWGIVLAIIGVCGLFGGGDKQTGSVVLCLALIVISAFLIISYCKSIRVYNEAVQKAAANGAVFKTKNRRKK